VGVMGSATGHRTDASRRTRRFADERPADRPRDRPADAVREHTVQVEKTLVMARREPTETDRLVRLVLATYGRLEALARAEATAASARRTATAG